MREALLPAVDSLPLDDFGVKCFVSARNLTMISFYGTCPCENGKRSNSMLV